MRRCTYRRLLRDTSGASIVIALVFFLICGIIGSVVVTAASVQAKSVQTHKQVQQDEYAMQSAAELVADQLGGFVASGQKAVVVEVSYDDKGKPLADVSQVQSQLGKYFWSKERAEGILRQTTDYIIGKPGASCMEINPPQGIKPVFATMVVDKDLNITVNMSLDKGFSASSPYNMTISIQCTPSYDIDGKLTAFSYGDNTVIEKASAA